MSLSQSRSRRANAGNRLRQLIEQERVAQAKQGRGISQGDEQLDEPDDVDFDQSKVPEQERADVVDSDFSDSPDEAEDQEAADSSQTTADDSGDKRPTTKKRPRALMNAIAAKIAKQLAQTPRPLRRVIKKLETESIQRAYNERRAKHRKRERTEKQPLSQAELLKEAQETERLNTEALRAFELQEEDQKQRSRLRNQVGLTAAAGPLVIFRSVATVDHTDHRAMHNTVSFASAFPLDASKAWWPFTQTTPEPTQCPITGLPARYKDPVTGIPYANAAAYRILQNLQRHRYRFSTQLRAFVCRQSQTSTSS
ncbi:hypothetical protein H4R34_003743 [Dimargaris verticillata]|uniref:Vps72/YL1 C-terminal domain-containing protein n=1 Tax=Dimargaris verticillata TaxID=2761393 RepID=A0A9W8AZG5_9FUNG|nr:hypothetical protein H4R34_003743 [Dimargaris verticillata]